MNDDVCIPKSAPWANCWGDGDMGYKWTPEVTKATLKLWNELADDGLMLVSGYPSGVVNFGKRIPMANGPMPFSPPFNNEGDHIGFFSELDSYERLQLCNAQNWSVMRAFQLGYEAANKNNN
jgi:hypothetical protein